MTSTRRRVLAVVSVVSAVLFAWRPLGARHTLRASDTGAPVRILSSSDARLTRRAPGRKGATYYALEGQTARLRMRFGDGSVAVAERGIDGSSVSELKDVNGNSLARFRVNRIDAANSVLQYEPAVGERLQAWNNAAVQPTLDWANRQAHALWHDRGAGKLEWRSGLMRATGAPALEDDVDELQTDWASGYSATMVRRQMKHQEAFRGRRVQDGPALLARVTLNGVEVATGAWYPRDQLFAYTLHGFGNSQTVFIGPEHLKKEYGGWPFVPDATWLNLQTIALHEFRSRIDRDGFVAKRRPSAPGRLAQFFFPIASANEPGCDGLHWLDGTILRYCCDMHDYCYEQEGCTAGSWWRWWTGWTCTVCNVEAFRCFASGTTANPCKLRVC